MSGMDCPAAVVAIWNVLDDISYNDAADDARVRDLREKWKAELTRRWRFDPPPESHAEYWALHPEELDTTSEAELAAEDAERKARGSASGCSDDRD